MSTVAPWMFRYYLIHCQGAQVDLRVAISFWGVYRVQKCQQLLHIFVHVRNAANGARWLPWQVCNLHNRGLQHSSCAFTASIFINEDWRIIWFGLGWSLGYRLASEHRCSPQTLSSMSCCHETRHSQVEESIWLGRFLHCHWRSLS